jgi:protein O-GlcNAc transferase
MDDPAREPIERALKLRADGKVSEAEDVCRDVLHRLPNHAGVLHLLGVICNETGRSPEGLSLLVRSVEAKPDDVVFQSNLAAALGSVGRLTEAAKVLRTVIRLQPDMYMAHNNLGVTLERLGRYVDAAEAYGVASEIKADEPMFLSNRGNVLRVLKRHDEAERAFRRAIALRDDYAPAWKGLALVLQQQGRLEESINHLREAIRLKPDDVEIHSTLVFCLHYSSRSTPEELLQEAKAWARHHAPLREASSSQSFPNNPVPDRRLRIAYLSPDFRDHVIGRLLEPVLNAHDRSAVEVYAYSDVQMADAATARIRSATDAWRDVAGVPDSKLEQLVREDRIDILVETAGHFAGNRLPFMGRRAAPVQISAFGYCGTSGVPGIDYRVTDPYSDPPGQTEAHHTERLLRLADCANCYGPADAYPDVGLLPALSAGHVTFCCFNNPVKITDRAVELWSQILRAVPGARLKLLLPGDAGQIMKDRFGPHGVEPERIEPVEPCKRYPYMELYNRCDICLDCFPFHGDNTTFDALWMGVPTITLAGDRFASRRGLSHMMNLGYREWVAFASDDYVARAVELAADLTRLAAIRAQLRPKFIASPLGDVARWTRNLEAAYRRIWKEWCERA